MSLDGEPDDPRTELVVEPARAIAAFVVVVHAPTGPRDEGEKEEKVDGLDDERVGEGGVRDRLRVDPFARLLCCC